jgi:hypothetical protein
MWGRREQIGHVSDEVFGHIVKAVNGIHAPIDNPEDYCDIAAIRQKRPPQSGYIRRCVPAGSIQARLRHAERGRRRTPQSIGQCRSVRLGAGLKNFLTSWQTFRSRKDTGPEARIASGHCGTRPPGAGARRHTNDLHWTSCLLLCAADAIVRYGLAALALTPLPVAEPGKRGWRTIPPLLASAGLPPCAGRLLASR